MHNPDHTKLTKTITVARYRELEKAGDRAALGEFIIERFHERYFEPIVDAPTRHGFTLMAIGCLVIEALQCFYEGRKDSKGKGGKGESGAMFDAFFKRQTDLKIFAEGKKGWFYKDIRCGILHQAETVGGWRVRRSGKLLDTAEHTINAKRFIGLLQASVADYANQFQTDDELWKKFCKKMDAVCKNCEPTG